MTGERADAGQDRYWRSFQKKRRKLLVAAGLPDSLAEHIAEIEAAGRKEVAEKIGFRAATNAIFGFTGAFDLSALKPLLSIATCDIPEHLRKKYPPNLQ